ncbi:MAG: hypothetical protein SO019_06215 [Lachnospiraceae bacterium]|nr:hypothetical protein [Lachnospiraceae bacterium]
MSIFQRKRNPELDGILSAMLANASNNYKDNAQADFRKFQTRLDELNAVGKLNEKQKAYYEDMRTKYAGEMKGFKH